MGARTELVHPTMVWYKDDTNIVELLPHVILLRVRALDTHYVSGTGASVCVLLNRLSSLYATAAKIPGGITNIRDSDAKRVGLIVPRFKSMNAAYFASVK